MLSSPGIDRSALLGLLFLVLGILLPTACVLWFMNEAMTAQVAGARLEVTEFHRRELRLLRAEIDARWRAEAAKLAVAPDESAAAAFARLTTAGLVDTVIVADELGRPDYPRPLPSLLDVLEDDPAERTALWLNARALEEGQRLAEAAGAYAALADAALDPSLAARAAQAAIRCRLRLGDRDAAIALLDRYFGAGMYLHAHDPLGRSIAADQIFLLAGLLPAGDARRAAAMARLAAMPNDYSRDIPSIQRLFLMESVAAESGAAAATLFATYEAERLAQIFLTARNGLDPGTATLVATRVPDVYGLAFEDGRGVALLRTASVQARVAELLPADTDTVRFGLVPPGTTPALEAIAAGGMLPGWQLDFTAVGDAAVGAVTRGHRLYYIWVAGLVVAAIAVTGLLVFGTYRRQLQVAALKTDLVAAVSHELKTPLSSMRLLVDTLLEAERPDARQTRDYLELIARENARLSRLIDSFLEFSRLERNRRHFDFARTRPADVVADAAAAVRERFDQAGCLFEVALDPDLPAVEADREALTTVLVNLLDNAFKYSRGERRIVLRASRDGESRDSARVLFTVEDNGIGIDARDRKRIFRRFFQVDRSLSRETGGVGLGLSIVELIVRAHRGSVRVASRPGAGSTFSVSLPAAAATA